MAKMETSVPAVNILIVDDRQENLLVTEKILKDLNAGIFKASSGNEALALLLRHHFAVVLLDVQMPEMDGFETAMLMREHENMANTPIIFVTAISKEEKYATQAAELGAADYIFKPINSEILRSKVKVYLDLHIQHQQILKLNEDLLRSNEELERFAYICSHDMQEPVRVMNNYAELISELYTDKIDDTGKKYLDYIVKNASHLRKMILDILTFSRVGREELELETVDCNRVLQQVLGEFESVIRAKSAKVTCGPMPILTTSDTLMTVLFRNLLGNALKFHKGSKPLEISIDAIEGVGEWEFSVKDNGIGIDPKDHDKVFVIFRRIYRREEFPGTGIGLSTCKKFLELYKGKIWFESEFEKGTVFHFTVPKQGKNKNVQSR